MTYDKAIAPEDIPKLFVSAWNARSADAIAALFEDEADFVNVVGIWWESREDIRKAHGYGLKVIFGQSEIRLGKVKTKYLSDTLAVVHARMRLDGQSAAKEERASARHNLFLFVARKHDEQWLCVSAQNTDIVPGAETHIMNKEGKLRPTKYSG